MRSSQIQSTATAQRAAAADAVAGKRVNVIGPTYGCFNAPSDLHEIKRLIAGAGGVINMVYPYESKLADTPRWSDGDVNIVMYREFGEPLAEKLGEPYLFAPMGMQETTAFIEQAGRIAGHTGAGRGVYRAREEDHAAAGLGSVEGRAERLVCHDRDRRCRRARRIPMAW